MAENLSSDASQTMKFLAQAYVAAGFPPIAEWGFNMSRKMADELVAAGLIIFASDDNWTLSTSGHAWIMNRKGEPRA